MVNRVYWRNLAINVFSGAVSLLASEFLNLLTWLLFALAATSCNVHGTGASDAGIVVYARGKDDEFELGIGRDAYDIGVLPVQLEVETRVLALDVALDLVFVLLRIVASINDAEISSPWV